MKNQNSVIQHTSKKNSFSQHFWRWYIGLRLLNPCNYFRYDEITFGVGHKSSQKIDTNKNIQNLSNLPIVRPSLYKIKFPSFNEDKLCIYSAFINMCALKIKQETTETLSRALSSSSDKPLHVCVELLKKHKVGYLNKVKFK